MPDIETDILLLRGALMAQGPPDRSTAEAAARYAGACAQVNERLRLCADLLRKGLRTEALQQAQVDPPVLDLFALVDFPERDQWLRYGGEQGLAPPPPLQDLLAVELNQAFAEADNLKEALRRHRLLALGRAPLQRRLGVLWRLARLDPLNPIWLKDVREFEKGRLREAEGELRAAAQKNDVARLERLLQELTAPDWTEPPPPGLAERARASRARYLAQGARERLAHLESFLSVAVAEEDVARARELAEQAGPLLTQVAGAPDDPVVHRVELALQWVREREARALRRRHWEQGCDELGHLLDDGEETPTLDQLRDVERRILSLGLGLPKALERDLGRRKRQIRFRRRVKKVFWTLILLGVLAGAGYLWFRFKGAGPDQVPVEKKEVREEERKLAQEVRAFLQQRCDQCHLEEDQVAFGKYFNPALLIEKTASRPKGKKYVAPGRPEESALWLRLSTDSMPPRKEPRLTDQEKTKIRTWISSGAYFPD